MEKKNQIVKTPDVALTKEKIVEFLKFNGVAKKMTNDETGMFIEMCQMQNLNPFKREIYPVKYTENSEFSIITGYEVYIKRAESTGLLVGWNVVTTGTANMSKPEESDLKAIITIYRKDWEHPFVWEVDFAEFHASTAQGNVTKFWKKAKFMTKKVAVSQGFRLCFTECAGLPYTKEEFETMDADVIELAEVESQRQTIEDLEQAHYEDVPEESAEDRANRLVMMIKDAEYELSGCKNREEINRVWKKYSELHAEPQFVEMVAKFGKGLQAEKEKATA